MILVFMIFFLIIAAMACGGWIITATVLTSTLEDKLKLEKKIDNLQNNKDMIVNGVRVTPNDVLELIRQLQYYQNLHDKSKTHSRKTFREILGLRNGVQLTRNMIQSAYLKQAKIYHPDMPNGSVKKMKAINMARDKALKSIGA